LTIRKFKLREWLVKHLNIVIHMFAQDFFVNYIFPFQIAIVDYNDYSEVGIQMNAYILLKVVGTIYFLFL